MASGALLNSYTPRSLQTFCKYLNRLRKKYNRVNIFMRQKFGHIVIPLLFLLFAGLVNARVAHSFHDGGAGSCDNCHSMHSTKDGVAALLVASDPSSVCLNCHAGSGGADNPSVYSADGSAMTPGGDFYWLTKPFTWSGGSSLADSHGHNVIALDFNLGQDPRLVSPGGTYRSEYLGCTSCHDPHGKTAGGTKSGALPVSVSGSYGELPADSTRQGNYRLLGGSHYGGGSAAAAQGFEFSQGGAPVARQNIDSKFSESDDSHVDYGTGMSEWCRNCHQSILDDHSGAGDFVHPIGSDVTLTNVFSMYNSYINTGDLVANTTGTGDIATAYLQFVPFERGTNDQQLLNPVSTEGPNATSKIMCLTCHRAHASAFRSIGRWDFDAVLLADSHPGPGDGGSSGDDVLSSYYGRNISSEFGPLQGPFCEKCHGLSLEGMPESSAQTLKPGSEPLPEPDSLQPQIMDPLLQDTVKRKR
jgi:predicted CXXCH cytochrome family protein